MSSRPRRIMAQVPAGGEPEACPICIDPLVRSVDVLRCGHRLHRWCADRAILQHQHFHCPLCRELVGIAWLEDELARLRQKIAKLRGERAALVKNRKRCGWHCETFLRSGRTREGQDAVAGRTRALRSGSTQGSTEARKRARR